METDEESGSIDMDYYLDLLKEKIGDNIKMIVTLIAPIAMEEGLKFAIREGGRTVGAGVVAKIIK